MNTKNTFSSTLLIVLLFLTHAESVNASGDYVWAKRMGATGNDYGGSIQIDSSGNVYSTGYFEGTVDFDPGAGTYNLTFSGSGSAYVSKLDSSGDFVWAKSLVGAGLVYGTSIQIDSSGNVYTTGYFSGTADFDPGVGTTNLTSAGLNDIFISKLDSSGDFVWAKSMGATAGDVGLSIQIDSSGNVYTAGSFNSTVDFDPGAGTSNLTSAGSYDIFISKLDSSGDFVWAKSMGGASTDYGEFLQMDSSGNLYTTGYFAGTADFDPGAGTSNLTSAGNDDIFISKLDSSGDFVWAKRMGGTSLDYGESLQIDSSGNVYTAGSFNGTVDFDPGAGTSNLTSAGSYDIFISKLDSSGDFVWAKRMGGVNLDNGEFLDIDSSGNVYTTGYFSGTADFDPGASTSNLVSAGGYDVFISKLDSSSNFVWAKRAGGTGSDLGYYLDMDSSGNIYTTGYFSSTADFDPGAGTSNLVSAGGADIFILKLSQISSPTITTTAASSITASGATLNGSITATGGEDATEHGFTYGTSATLATVTATTTLGSYSSTGSFNETASSLVCNTTYYFRPYATNSAGTAYGSIESFSTSYCSPTITTETASSVTTSSAVLNGNITDTGGEANTIRGFDIGLDTGYTMSDITESGPHSTGAYSLNVTGLDCGTTYHYRAYSSNTISTGVGTDNTFTTKGCSRSSSGSIIKNTTTSQTIPTAVYKPTCSIVGVNRTLSMGSRGEDVRILQKFLNCKGFHLATTGPGSTGNETYVYSIRTRNAVTRYQEHYASDILSKLNLTKGTGIFGQLSRKKAMEVVDN